jgi:multiple sugar transport system substrate-binding protein
MKIKGLWIACSLIMLFLAACSRQGTSNTPQEQTSTNGGSVTGEEKGDNEVTTGTGGKKTIVFSTFWPDERFKEAKKKYEAKHPNIEIKLEFIETDDQNLEATLEKFVTTTNTAMLAGKGADLIEMDLLPIDKYVNNNLLVDLNKMMEQDSSFRKDDFFVNVLDHATIGEGLYGMPLSFFLFGLLGDEDAIEKAGVKVDDSSWTWNEFAETAKELAKKGEYKHAFTSQAEYLLDQMVTDNYSLFVDEASRKAKFDTKAFTDLMQQVKKMFDEKVISDDGREKAYFMQSQINSSWDYLVALREFAEHAKLYAKPNALSTEPGGYFRTYKTIGLNAKSTVKAEAWDFIKFLTSEELQHPPESAGIPIRQSIFEKQVKQLQAAGEVQAYKEGPLQGMTFKVDNEILQQLEAYVNGAVHAVAFKTTKLNEIITKESQAFFSGQKSAEEVAKLIQNKATTYLNE